jgi:hypothetical protein
MPLVVGYKHTSKTIMSFAMAASGEPPDDHEFSERNRAIPRKPLLIG